MKKCLMLLLAGCLAWAGASAQTFMYGAGATISVMTSKVTDDYFSTAVVRSDLTFFPRMNVLEMGNSSLSFGVPLSAGISLARSTYDNETGIYWGLDFPAVVDFNMGFKATAESEGNFGGYIGSGFGYTLTSLKIGGTTTRGNSYGPLFRGGVRFGFPSSDTDLGLTVGLFYKIGLEEEKFRTFGFNVLVDF